MLTDVRIMHINNLQIAVCDLHNEMTGYLGDRNSESRISETVPYYHIFLREKN